jgi:DNA invertase Pin-like site-specific DNA recombinase
MMRGALYCRVSTLYGQHPEMQLAELRDYASRRGWEVKGEYVDEGVSGSKRSRPELHRLMVDAHRRHRSISMFLCEQLGVKEATSSAAGLGRADVHANRSVSVPYRRSN